MSSKGAKYTTKCIEVPVFILNIALLYAFLITASHLLAWVTIARHEGTIEELKEILLRKIERNEEKHPLTSDHTLRGDDGENTVVQESDVLKLFAGEENAEQRARRHLDSSGKNNKRQIQRREERPIKCFLATDLRLGEPCHETTKQQWRCQPDNLVMLCKYFRAATCCGCCDKHRRVIDEFNTETVNHKKKSMIVIPCCACCDIHGPEVAQTCINSHNHLKGVKGDRGEKGDKGDQGRMGRDGRDGLAGPRGQRGDAGMQGPQGYQGSPGPQGIPGSPGVPGGKGSSGSKGEKGNDGRPGKVVKYLHSAHIVASGKKIKSERHNKVISPKVTWKAQYRSGKMHYNNGYLTVGIDGVYFVYCQMFYYDGTSSYIGYEVYLDGKKILKAVHSIVSKNRKYETQYTSGIFEISKGQKISVESPFSKYYYFNETLSFFGAFMLHEKPI